MPSQLLTVKQVQEKLQVCDETVYRYIRSGKLKAVHIGGLLRVDPDELEAFIKGDNHESSK